MFILYTLVIFIDLVVYKPPNEDRKKKKNFLIIKILVKLAEQAPFSLISLIFFLSFSLAKHPMRMSG